MTFSTVTPLILAGAFFAVLFEYVPGFAEWFAALSTRKKQGTMALLMLLVALGLGFYNCRFNALCPVEGTQAWLENLFLTFVLALSANQTTYLISRK